MHFLTEGDTLDPTTGEITWNPDKMPCSPVSRVDPSDSIFSGVNYRTVSIEVAKGPEGERVVNCKHAAHPQRRTRHSRAHAHARTPPV